jgi:hypothetical protein
MKKSIISRTLFQKGGSARTGKAEPLRVLNGTMSGRTISGKFTRQGRPMDFSFVMTKAEYSKGELRLHGKLNAGQASEEVVAAFSGAIIRPFNPWPGPSEELKKDAQKAEKGAALERNEQTQSLYVHESEIAGCELFFLNVTPSAKFRTSLNAAEKVQIGVALSSFDNKSGEEISRQVWRVLRLQPDSGDVKKTVDELNRLLGS